MDNMDEQFTTHRCVKCDALLSDLSDEFSSKGDDPTLCENCRVE